MDPYRPPSYPAVLGDLAYAAALALFLFLQRIAHKLREEEVHAWWASNGRDVVNGLAVVTVSTAIWLQGIAPALALLFGATLTLLLSVLHTFLEGRVVEPWRLVIVAAVILGAPLVLAPRQVAEATDRLVQEVFPTPGSGHDLP